MTKIIYLKGVNTLQELKKLYYAMAMKLHPDHGGDLEAMKRLNNEFDFLKTKLPNEQQKNDNTTKKQYQETTVSMDQFRDIIEELLRYPKITIEIIGSWLWISGTGTFKIKDEILYKKLHCEYSKSNKKFYWYSGIENKSGYYKGGYLKKAIATYGVHTIQSDDRPVLT